MFKKLSTHFVVSTLFTFCISALLSFIIANVYYHLFLKPANDDRITQIVKEQKHFIESHPEIKPATFFAQMASLNFQVMTVHDHEVNYYGTPFRVKNLEDGQDGIYHGIKERPFNLFITGFFDNETRNTVGIDMQVAGEDYRVYIRPDVGQSMGEFRIFLAILLVYILIFTVFFIILSAGYFVNPVKKLQLYAKRIRSGDYSDQSSITRRDEIGELAREMEEMSIAIRHHQAVNERFVANVSHEIQSPITNLIGLTDQLADHYNSETIAAIQHQSRRLSGLTKQLLTLASIENEGNRLQLKTFSGKDMMKEVINTFMYQLDEKELLLTTHFDDSELTAHRALLMQLVTNLLSNAIKYSKQEGSILITLKNQVITIEDEGVGMDDKTQQHLFERFFKSKSNEDHVPSNGLGMAIVKEIADLHGFKIEVNSAVNQGTTITVVC
ncbi:HAMP domain-containing histidine kinase [Macrococcus brunensis]|uniref:Heme sensor protein HssS n=1 Tax=Macrococcus brunensis TaxID=198483 RepID=A0A4V3BDT8_9STAP|nr:HAMP domain-containing sensor histidine kinase [Macrococcus brunensis]TDL98726.1 HAMP domain-containing histidine kinase [Macrococcus brunensis]